MNITRGTKKKAQRIVIYATEGVGKTTFTAQLPNPIFIDTEDGTDHLDVARLDKPTSWIMLMGHVQALIVDNHGFNTLVIDTADWAEKLCVQHICDIGMKQSIEDFGYGQGYTKLAEEFARLLDLLSTLRDRGMNICLTAHSIVKRHDEPSGMDSYDRYELKLGKKTSPLLKEWSDAVLFADYKTIIVESDGGKKKGIGGTKRVLHTIRTAAFDAKNRWGLPVELPFDMPFDFSHIGQHLLVQDNNPSPVQEKIDVAPVQEEIVEPEQVIPNPEPQIPQVDPHAFNTALFDLMKQNSISKEEIEGAVVAKGFFPVGTPLENYGDDFVNQMLIANWPGVASEIVASRTNEPNI
tara:strand:+ start:1962 stop:3017 length:1056 start_codon:yes stop_codon:yes gene_type:complete